MSQPSADAGCFKGMAGCDAAADGTATAGTCRHQDYRYDYNYHHHDYYHDHYNHWMMMATTYLRCKFKHSHYEIR